MSKPRTISDYPNRADDYEEAVSKMHDQNTDTALDQGGDNEVTAEAIRDHVDSTDNPHGVTAGQVGAYTKAETDQAIADAEVDAYTKAEADNRFNEKMNTVSQSEAQAGTATTRRAWTAQRVRQAITSWWNSVTTKNGPLTISSPGYNEHLTLKRGDLEVSLAPSTGSNSGTSPEMRFTAPTMGDVPGWWFDGRVSAKDGFYIEATRKDTVWDAKVGPNDSRLSNSREWTASTVSQSEAQAGTSTTRRAWTAQRVRQAIERLASVRGGTGDTGVITTSGTRAVIASAGSRANANRAVVIASHQGEATGADSAILGATEGGIASGDRSIIISGVNCEATQTGCTILASRAVGDGGFSDRETTLWGFGDFQQGASSANRTVRIASQAGTIQASGSIDAGEDFGDYAEFFQNGTGQEIEPGILVTMQSGQVVPAQDGDDVIGVVSATAVVTLGSSQFCWHGRYLKDEWGRNIMEDIPDPAWKPDEEKEETEADRPIITVRKQNPEWDPTQEQIPREDRPDEWTVVGLLGQVLVRVADSVQIGDYIQPGTNNVATTSTEKTNLRVMRETQEFDSNKGYKIVLCLLK